MKQINTMIPLLKRDSFFSSTYQKNTIINNLDRNLIPFEEWKEEWKRIYYKEYPRFKKITLKPEPSNINNTLLTSLENRSSQRNFSPEKITFSEISNLLHYSSGINHQQSNDIQKKRFFPSGGMRYPIETYLLINGQRVEGLEQYSYHYNIKRNCLEQMFELNNFTSFMDSIYVQGWAGSSNLTLCLSAVFDRSRIKYGDRGYRYCLFEAGHIGQNIYLLCSSMGLKCCALGGFSDVKINQELELNTNKESVVYLFSIGK